MDALAVTIVLRSAFQLSLYVYTLWKASREKLPAGKNAW